MTTASTPLARQRHFAPSQLTGAQLATLRALLSEALADHQTHFEQGMEEVLAARRVMEQSLYETGPPAPQQQAADLMRRLEAMNAGEGEPGALPGVAQLRMMLGVLGGTAAVALAIAIVALVLSIVR